MSSHSLFLKHQMVCGCIHLCVLGYMFVTSWGSCQSTFVQGNWDQAISLLSWANHFTTLWLFVAPIKVVIKITYAWQSGPKDEMM